MKPYRFLFFAACAVLAAFPAAAAEPGGAGVLKHLALARELAQNVAPDDNRYVLGGRSISFPGDGPASRYSMKADCAGFMIAVLDRAGYDTWSHMVLEHPSSRRTRPRAEDFVFSITKEKAFQRVMKVEDLRPGDVLAHEMLNPADRAETGTTGHVMFVNSTPGPIPARNPVVKGTHQFEVRVIDSNREYLGDDDSRLADPAHKVEGLGTGTIRLYADDAGELVGFARTFKKAYRFFSYSPRFPSDTKLRIAAMGRPLASN